MISRKSQKIGMLVYPEKCVGCLLCQLRCSMRLTNTFNPSRAAIRIQMASDKPGADIVFTRECDSCGICARHCPYGALKIQKEGVRQDGED